MARSRLREPAVYSSPKLLSNMTYLLARVFSEYARVFVLVFYWIKRFGNSPSASDNEDLPKPALVPPTEQYHMKVLLNNFHPQDEFCVNEAWM